MTPTPQWLIRRLSECLNAAPEPLRPAIRRVRSAVSTDTVPSVSDVTTALIGALVVSDEGISVSSLKSEIAILQHQCADLKRINRALRGQIEAQPRPSTPPSRPIRPNVRYRAPNATPPKPRGGFEMAQVDRESSRRLNQRRADLGLPTGGVITLEDGTTAFKLDKF